MDNDFINIIIDNTNYVFSFVSIQEVVSINEYKIHKVPLTRKELIGLINLHGNIVAVVDLKQILVQKKTKVTSNNKLLIIELAGENVALIVDDVPGLISGSPDEISRDFIELDSKLLKNITGVIKQNNKEFFVLDTDALMNAVF